MYYFDSFLMILFPDLVGTDGFTQSLLCFGDLFFLVTLGSTDLVGYSDLCQLLSFFIYFWVGEELDILFFIKISYIYLIKIELWGDIYFAGMHTLGSC